LVSQLELFAGVEFFTSVFFSIAFPHVPGIIHGLLRACLLKIIKSLHLEGKGPKRLDFGKFRKTFIFASEHNNSVRVDFQGKLM
jgi:hypothetical protein